jgi:hypothetical protein
MMMSACAATGLVGNCWDSGPGLLGATGVAAVVFQRLPNKDVCLYRSTEVGTKKSTCSVC